MGGQLNPPDPSAKGWTLVAVAIGAICGGFIAPLVGGRIGRRITYFGMCVASLAVCQVLFRVLPQVYNGWFLLMAGIAGFCTASFYGWLPLYLPELFPTRVRATAQGVSFNFGRIFAAAGALGTGSLMGLFDGSYPRAAGHEPCLSHRNGPHLVRTRDTRPTIAGLRNLLCRNQPTFESAKRRAARNT